MTRKNPPTKARRDGNEDEVVESLEFLGCVVERFDIPTDLEVYDPVTDLIIKVEVKMPKGKLTTRQRNYHAKMPALNLWIVESGQEAVDKMFAWRSQANEQ